MKHVNEQVKVSLDQYSFQGQTKMPAKFINTKLNIGLATANPNKAQPVRARTNLDNYEEAMPLAD